MLLSMSQYIVLKLFIKVPINDHMDHVLDQIEVA